MGDGDFVTDRLFTGQRQDLTGLYHYGAREYDPVTGRFIQPDPIVPSLYYSQDLNRYTYIRNNPLHYVDPSGTTVRSALALVREYREDIISIAEKYDIDPILLAGVVFAENRNDYNWIREVDYSSAITFGLFGGAELKNIFGPLLKTNVPTGITEVTVAVAAMMDDSSSVSSDYGDVDLAPVLWSGRKATTMKAGGKDDKQTSDIHQAIQAGSCCAGDGR